jgi:hypothetical protein
MNIRMLHLIALLLTLAVVQSSSAATDETLSITLTKRTITASGLAPGSAAVFFGVAQVPIPHAYMTQVLRWAVTVEDSGRNGSVTLDLQQDVPRVSVWAVVDLRTGHYRTFSGPGVGLREASLANPLRRNTSQVVDRFAFDHRFLDLLYVHPGLGAWTWSAVGGTSTSEAGPNGSTVVSLSAAKPLVQGAQAPPSFLAGGILVAIDFTRLEIAVVQPDEKMIGGAP